VTELLERAFAEAAKLPPAEQEALARMILDELRAERLWQDSFDASADMLARLADEALEDFRAGRTEPLDPDGL
jgi:aspartate/glutamate racemase